ncbi:hypothetical protein Aoki45_02350 [Algoriphagus sp. oki45]|uniref:VOC family protein n=1 Tax=Algoriphagus sp. oki45 TaxID=3067294 RepID=UPI0027FA0B2F|nr:hypothetical protein Aoki45_02350 [Algoriphagus sp. oki45]
MGDFGYQLNGIQQVGIGVINLEESWKWYRKAFGMDVPIFQDKAEAYLMKGYTGGEVHSRHAVLAMNMQGGGGFEIWQFTSRKPTAYQGKTSWGDLGIFAVKIRSRDVLKSKAWLLECGAEVVTPIFTHPDSTKSFFIRDPFANLFEIRESESWFKSGKSLHGGVLGVCIGVSDLDQSLLLYQNILGFSEQVYLEKNHQAKWENDVGTSSRTLLEMKGLNPGAFGALLCKAQVELVQLDQKPTCRIFQDRYWGDLGFIHCCLDVNGMHDLKAKAQLAGYPFTVDSEDSFDMGTASGHFCYLEDRDSTLIEMVETHKVPIFEKFNWYIHLKSRDHRKNLPSFLVRMLAINRVKD